MPRRHRLTAALLALALAAGCQTPEPATPARWADPAAAGASTPARPPAPTRSPTASPSPSAAPVACPEPRQAPDTARELDPSSAGYLGGSGEDSANAVDVTPRCEIVVGGRFTDVRGGVTTTLGRGPGAVLRLDATGRRLLGVTRLAGTVADLEVRRPGGEIAVGTDRGVALLDPTARVVRWQRPGAAERIAVGSAGTVAAVVGGQVKVYDRSGTPRATLRPDGRTVHDVAVDDRHGLVLVGGYRQANAPPCGTVQIPWLHGYDRSGRLRWRAYDHAAGQLGDRCADSRVERVALGRDGRLYLAGLTDGGNSVFGRSAADLGREAPNVGTDRYAQPFNTGNAQQTYLARFDPASGRQLAGTFLLARLASKGDRGNTITPSAITADEKGRLYAGGVSAYQIADRDRITLNGRRLAPYAGGDAWVLVLSADLRRRTTWVVFTDGGAGTVRAVAAGSGIAAVAARVDRGPFHRGPGRRSAASGGYLAAWPGLR
ncbi:hypothetical protein [Micromonospora siamensis]|uniref:PQQ-like domain-containing protein n=1 Tax=Micromonospora siamensis TaxID=299152 RepID=A0A1C5H7K1_9ACTN|nr:hypothetical protein [Micromonospora siamensis]SCG41421.1 hypothetical protein GA0074704_1122 [Micromonospora siamensis]